MAAWSPLDLATILHEATILDREGRENFQSRERRFGLVLIC